MRFQHRFGALSFFNAGDVMRALLHLFALRSNRAIGLNIENLIESEAGKKFVAPSAAMNDVKMSLAKFFQSQRHRRHCAHKGGIHHRAMFEINDELAVTAVDHLLREFFQATAVEEVALPFYSHPNGGAVHAH